MEMRQLVALAVAPPTLLAIMIEKLPCGHQRTDLSQFLPLKQ